MDQKAKLEKMATKVAKKVSPTPAEAKEEKLFALDIMKKIGPSLKEAELKLVGSTARDTGLRGDKDIDIFACFPVEMEEEEIVEKTRKALGKIDAKWEMHYAEHPYFQTVIDRYRVEVIPCFQAKPHTKIKSAVDRSPLHMDYLQKNMTKEQGEDVRALKQLLKANGLYGAESEVRGFSGILCEYLMMNYRSFGGLVEAVKDWKPPVKISFVESDKTFDAPLTFIDAVDSNRNVAAVISLTQLCRFISLAQALWEKPSEALFFAKKTKPANIGKALKSRGTTFFFVELEKPEIVEDIILPQLERTKNNIHKHLERGGFSVLSSAYFADKKKAFLFFELASPTICRVKKTIGPPVMNPKAVKQFVKGKRAALRGPWIEEDKVVVEEERDITKAEDLLKKIKNNPVRFGVGSHVQKPLKRAKIHRTVPKMSAEASLALAQHVFRKEAWF